MSRGQKVRTHVGSTSFTVREEVIQALEEAGVTFDEQFLLFCYEQHLAKCPTSEFIEAAISQVGLGGTDVTALDEFPLFVMELYHNAAADAYVDAVIQDGEDGTLLWDGEGGGSLE